MSTKVTTGAIGSWRHPPVPPAWTSDSLPIAIIWTHRNNNKHANGGIPNFLEVTCLLRSLFSILQLDNFLFTDVGDISEVGIRPLRSCVLHCLPPLLLNSLVHFRTFSLSLVSSLLPLQRTHQHENVPQQMLALVSHANDGTLERSIMNPSVPLLPRLCTTNTQDDSSTAAEAVLRSCFPLVGRWSANE